MTGLIGDRKEKSALDEMEEVARQRNRDVAEEERLEKIEAERRAREEAERGKAPSEEKVIIPAGSITPVYNGLKWELKVPFNKNQEKKELFSYDESLKRLKKAGYERHPLPAEAFSLIADNLEGKLQGHLKAVADNMLLKEGDWLSMAFERKEDLLIAYPHPKGLIWDVEGYIKHNFTHAKEETFNIKGIDSGHWINLSDFDDAFVQYIYGRSFDKLPKEMRSGFVNGLHTEVCPQVYLPPEGVVSPIGRGGFGGGLLIYSEHCDNCNGKASRGVKEKRP